LSAIYLTGLHNSQRKIIHNLEKATNRNALSNDASIRAGEALSLYKNKLAFAKSINDDEIILKRLDKQYFDEMISSLLEGI
jgi:hypothetical protein